MSDREKQLERCLRSLMELDWMPEGAPGPAFYMVSPVHEARAALARAGVLLDGVSYFPSDTNGATSVGIGVDGKIDFLGVWFDGMCYGEKLRDKVPPQYLELFDAAIIKVRTTHGGT